MGGSFLVVDHIAHGLLGTGAQATAVAPIQGVAAVHQASSSQAAPSLSGDAAGDDGDQDTAPPPLQPAVTATPPAAAQPPQAAPSHDPASGGSLVVSPGGTVMASCQSGLAYLQYWTPSQGYQADDVIRGPAATARIGFEQLASEYEISVTCNGSNPVAKVTAG
jgi:hypothetical protein